MVENLSLSNHLFPVRKPEIHFDESIKKYHIGNNAYKTFYFIAFHLMLPEGERFFIRSAQNFSSKIQNAKQRKQVMEFCGQEGNHSNTIQQYLNMLNFWGYPVERLQNKTRTFLNRVLKKFPKQFQLAFTVGTEHLTTSMVEALYEAGTINDKETCLKIRFFWYYHALEELEHKAVAYDLFSEIYPRSYFLRCLSSLFINCVIFYFIRSFIKEMVKYDIRMGRLTKQEFERSKKEVIKSKKGAKFKTTFRRLLLSFYKPGFHPNQNNTDSLLEDHQKEYNKMEALAIS